MGKTFRWVRGVAHGVKSVPPMLAMCLGCRQILRVLVKRGPVSLDGSRVKIVQPMALESTFCLHSVFVILGLRGGGGLAGDAEW